ncbi:1-acyl-sn-glycerol-3-phosphate acyltransferase [Lentibacillus halodurans]|uniref:1-acyl-sn-glycerol-3-phosphate acyltransferase n=1 Tax=Lentibacillus halodurans TaxID=237679 RepID=A0A1I0ZCQ0_9BACI|nr:lysophospholipid acyltransferase family protein [Lentibacillus halodurans]SFB22188.1 1-acyl-sn-glycerol-3-phosphate acyltransferase [Lentibacillus halodurans]
MLYTWLRQIAKLLIHSRFRVEVIGYDNIPRHQTFIVAANHTSYYDPILLACIINRPIHFMAKAELFQNYFCSYFLSLLHAIPVDRQSRNVIHPVRKSLRIIDNGNIFGIFPEGKRCKNEMNVAPKKGVAFFACKTKVPILPVAIKGIKKGYRTPVKIIIGAQIITDQFDTSDYATISLNVMDRIRKLRTNAD